MKPKPIGVLAERLSAARNLAGRKAVETASAIGVTKATLSYWENGKVDPTASGIAKLARFLGVSSDYLLGLSDIPAPSAQPAASAAGGSVAIGTQANSGGDNSIRVGGAASAAEQSEREARLCAELAEKSAEILNLRGIVATLQKAIDTICARRGGKAAAGAGAE